MKITIDFRHPQSFERIALIERETLNGKQARRVMEAVEAEQGRIGILMHHEDMICTHSNIKLSEWSTHFKTWKECITERKKLETLRKRYAIRRYDRKPLDQLTSYEVAQMDETDRELYEWCMTPIDRRA